jgi:hypothetical protein
MGLGALLLVGAGALVLPEIFGFVWFFLTLPAYLLLVSGVNVGAVFGIAGPPLVTLALCGLVDLIVKEPWSHRSRAARHDS